MRRRRLQHGGELSGGLHTVGPAPIAARDRRMPVCGVSERGELLKSSHVVSSPRVGEQRLDKPYLDPHVVLHSGFISTNLLLFRRQLWRRCARTLTLRGRHDRTTEWHIRLTAQRYQRLL